LWKGKQLWRRPPNARCPCRSCRRRVRWHHGREEIKWPPGKVYLKLIREGLSSHKEGGHALVEGRDRLTRASSVSPPVLQSREFTADRWESALELLSLAGEIRGEP